MTVSEIELLGLIISVIVAITNFIAIFIVEYYKKSIEIRGEKVKRFAEYAVPLQRQICLVHDRIAYQRERMIEKGGEGKKSSLLQFSESSFMDQNTRFSEIISTLSETEFEYWCYDHGHSLCATCYDIACFFAFAYLFQTSNSISYIEKNERSKIEYMIAQIHGLFDQNAGIWQSIQTDIAHKMINKNSTDKLPVISFHDFCIAAYSSVSLQKVFEFVIQFGDYGRRSQTISILIAFYDMYAFLEKNLQHYFGNTVAKMKRQTPKNRPLGRTVSNNTEVKDNNVNQCAKKLQAYLETDYLQPCTQEQSKKKKVTVNYQKNPMAYVPLESSNSNKFNTLEDYEVALKCINSFIFPSYNK